MEEERINADGDGDTEMSGVVSSQVGSGDTVGSARRKRKSLLANYWSIDWANHGVLYSANRRTNMGL